jgi:hypothetical protein
MLKIVILGANRKDLERSVTNCYDRYDLERIVITRYNLERIVATRNERNDLELLALIYMDLYPLTLIVYRHFSNGHTWEPSGHRSHYHPQPLSRPGHTELLH